MICFDLVMGSKKRELTFLSILIGIIIAVVMTAANTYLGLYAGMTVSASIPAAVMAMGVYTTLLKRKSVLECNIVQTMASAGESVAAGIIFTIPALVITGVWNDFAFWPTTLIAISGGLLGVVFMIPLRKALIEKDKNLVYPEGVACAAVLQASTKESSGVKPILYGLFLGGLIKLLSGGLKILQAGWEKAFFWQGRTWFVGSDLSPALLAVGYIIDLKIAVLVFIGGAIGWLVGVPLLGVEGIENQSALEYAWYLWSHKIRYLGVGAMVVGGLWSVLSVRQSIVSATSELKSSLVIQRTSRVQQDMNLYSMAIIFLLNTMVMLFLYIFLTDSLKYGILATFIMVFSSFFLVAVSSYIVGLVGSSNQPVSGITISALIATASLFTVLGFVGNSAILATLGVAAVVCCASCTSGDCSQDLKTGIMVGATPKYQQWAQVIGVVIPAFVIAPVLTILHKAYVIGEGLKAPQATLFASIVDAFFKTGTLPYSMLAIGVCLGILVIILDEFFLKPKKGFRLHLMPMAVGIYLPITLAVPILMGGIIRYFVRKKRSESKEESDAGVLAGSGMIAGEAIMGVLLAVFVYFSIDMQIPFTGQNVREILSLIIFLALALWLYRCHRLNR